MQIQVESAAFAPTGGTGSVRISAARECTWSAQSDAAWLRLSSPTEGQGEGSVQFTVAPNADPPSRTAQISVKDERLQVSQSGRPCAFEVSSTRELMDPPGGERTIEVGASSAQCGWTAATDVPWIAIVAGREGTGNGAVVFRVDAATGPQRTGTIAVAGQSVLVEQGTGCTVSINPSTVSVGPQGGDGSIQVASAAGCEWTVSANASWIRVLSGARGSGAGRVEFTVAANPGTERTGSVIVAGRTVTVSQQDGCTFALDRDEQSFGAGGGSGAAVVTAAPGCAWSATSGAAWITIAGASSGSGSGQVPFAVAANSGPAREAVVTIRGARLTIAQASGCTYTIAPSGQDVPATGGAGAFSIGTAAGCPWRATTVAEWMTLSDSSGTGPQQIRFDAARNSGPPRSATISVAGYTFTVSQGSPCTYLFAPANHVFDANGGAGNILVIVSGPCTWTAASTVDWIRMTGATSGTGNGLVQFTTAPNPGPARTGNLVIAGQNYLVTQRAR